MRCKTNLLVGAVSVGLALPSAAIAQDAGTFGSDEIIVTARKRNETILKVPVIETALTATQLESYASNSLDSIADRVPGLQLGKGTPGNGTQVSLRGVGSGVLNPGIDSSVAVNLDGVQITTGNAFLIGMFDTQQVEVLKGPQGLFFGKNNPGGVIALRSADPRDELEVIGRVSYEFEAREKRAEFIVSGPVSDSLKLRLATYYADASGYFKNATLSAPELGGVSPRHKRFDPSEKYMVRGTALFEPSSHFQARLKFNYMHLDEEGNSPQVISCPDGLNSLVGVPFLGGGEDCRLDRKVRAPDLLPQFYQGIRNGGVPNTEFDLIVGSLELNYNLSDGLKLTSLTGYNWIDQFVVLNVGSTFAGSIIGVNTAFNRRDITQEVRLTSDYPDRPVNFMIGGFFHDSNITVPFDLPYNQALPFPFPANVNSARHEVDVRAISAFGQVLWKVVPQIELSAGARWTHEKRTHLAVDTLLPILVPGSPERVIPIARPKLSPSNISPEFTITYTPTDDLTLFASYKQGFKSGSFSLSGTPADNSDTSFNDEKVKGAEAGLKARLADRSVNLTLAGYYYRYSDLQVGANEVDIANGRFGVRTLNAASAKVYGIDFDVSYRPPQIENFSLYGAVNWNKARYIKYENAPCWGGQLFSEGCNRDFSAETGLYNSQDLSGRPLLRAPEWSANFGFDHRVPVGNDLAVEFGSAVSYTSSLYFNFLLREDMRQGDYFKLNARVAIKSEDNRWELALIGNNLNNEITCGNATNGNFQNGLFFGGVVSGGTMRGPAGVDEVTCRADRGREVQLRLSVKL